MDKPWMHIHDRLHSREYEEGVRQFLAMAVAHTPTTDQIRCPCRRCRNRAFHSIRTVEDHLFLRGFDPTYQTWIFHGEDDPFLSTPLSDEEQDDTRDFSEYPDDLDEMLDDIRHGSYMGSDWQRDGDVNMDDQPSTSNSQSNFTFEELVADARRPLYPSCKQFSKLSFIVKLLHIKSIGSWTVKSFDMVIKLLQEAFPEALFPDSYADARRLERGLGFSYEKIHVCPNDCALFWKENATYNECPKCQASRWEESTSPARRIPKKVLRYFPLKPRLQRLYMSNKTSQAMRWHVEGRVDDPTCMRHPSDSRVWKDFDIKHHMFSQDPRNVRLGLASDGFNPFNNMSRPYSIWPVLLVPYNLPPWSCMKDPYTMLSLLIPGPKSPGNNIDVFLRPLIDELKELWEEGVRTYDAYSGQNFTLHAALLWTINDFPAYANLSGWSTKGKMACPYCTADTNSQWLVYGRKHCYMGHRRWLPVGHTWRRKKNAFNGFEEHRLQPSRVDGNELLEQLSLISHVEFGKSTSKRKRTPNQLNWTKKSIFFELPYWLFLGLRHNLDVMHIEKNICDNILGTLLNIEGKTKDSANARRDMANLGIRKELHLQHEGDRVTMGLGCYMLNGNERKAFCAWLSKVKFPDGFASNIGRCVNANDGKISGMKSHDCHVFLQALLPVVIGGFLRADVRQALIELSGFFKELCSRTLNISVLDRLKANIPIILCKLEMIFPPAFFDIMLHLSIHLPEEALLAGPVQYRWMYPFERYLGKFKRYVRNRARPEGSIAEAYVHLECLTFCSMYLHDIETKFNRDERNSDVLIGEVETGNAESLSVFSQKVRPLGTPHSHILPDSLLSKARWTHYNKMKEEDPDNIDRRHQSQFPSWFRSLIRELRAVSPTEVTDEIYALACGPDPCVASYAGCIMNGVRFHTQERERHRRTQNCGVVVHGEHQGSPVEFYGLLHDIIEIRYMGWRKVYLFQCTWYDVGDPRRGIRVRDHLTLVNTGRQWYKDEPFALASQVTQVFYLPDPILGGSWQVVQKVTSRNVYNIPPVVVAPDDDDSDMGDFEDEEHNIHSNYPPILDVDEAIFDPLNRVDEETLPVDVEHLSRLQPGEPVDEDVLHDHSPIREDMGTMDLSANDNSDTETVDHLNGGTDDDDGNPYLLVC
ncbi:uncharacterized protein LOC122316221 [Carya illinoinensis]|uniref:uncharacterized protein LOC122316221 n=1 Tax=Carya illinoinensis TaxID=32201 RepID=UPI001C721F43|nr:uncharacterized protein LOC122316221 [Carya illinoinensis]